MSDSIFSVSGIKCDFCDWIDDSVQYDDYPQWINKECPECQANLLTQDDYNACKEMVDMSLAIGAVQGDPTDVKGDDVVEMRAEFNGTGRVSHISISDFRFPISDLDE